MLGASGEVGPAWDGAEGGNRRFLVTEFILVSRGEVGELDDVLQHEAR